jgi:hypothetical protein
VDSIKLDSIRQVFTNFLSKIIVIDTDTITDKNTDYCNKKVAYYNRYRQMYPMSVVALDMEQYLYHKDIYDDYIDIKNINFLLLKYLT